ncbi:unannotated protein [freshwater metagenome]|uniref:Unannotated protein n=1 Tax=freshwater metagenome TaxID=449393 RepID=A0A6J6LWF1_9ZZZZ
MRIAWFEFTAADAIYYVPQVLGGGATATTDQIKPEFSRESIVGVGQLTR